MSLLSKIFGKNQPKQETTTVYGLQGIANYYDNQSVNNIIEMTSNYLTKKSKKKLKIKIDKKKIDKNYASKTMFLDLEKFSEKLLPVIKSDLTKLIKKYDFHKVYDKPVNSKILCDSFLEIQKQQGYELAWFPKSLGNGKFAYKAKKENGKVVVNFNNEREGNEYNYINHITPLGNGKFVYRAQKENKKVIVNFNNEKDGTEYINTWELASLGNVKFAYKAKKENGTLIINFDNKKEIIYSETGYESSVVDVIKSHLENDETIPPNVYNSIVEKLDSMKTYKKDITTKKITSMFKQFGEEFLKGTYKKKFEKILGKYE